MTEPPDPGWSGTYDITVDEGQGVPGGTPMLRSLAEHVLRRNAVPAGASLAVAFVDAGRIAALKEEFFGIRQATDVLAFPVDNPDDPAPGPLVLGDVVICPEVAERQARALGRTSEDEIALLLVHGILHVLGRTHTEPALERAMRWEERDLLASFRTPEAAGR